MAEPAPVAAAAAPAAAAPTAAAASRSNEDDAATEPSGQQQQALHSATSEMLTKMSKYVEGEAEISVEDYRLLQAMNLAAAERYSNMAEYSAGLVTFAERLQGKCEEMMPQLAQVNGIGMEMAS